jgi:hypothetical protein
MSLKLPLLSPPLFFHMAKPWTEYLKSDDLLRMMCRWRARMAAKRHPVQVLSDRLLVPEPERDNPVEDRIRECLPSRRKWIRLGSSERRRVGESRMVETAIYRSALRVLNDSLGEKPGWTVKWANLLREVETLRQEERIAFHAPTLHLKSKGKGEKWRRCLASFEHPADRLLISRAATYLRDVFDPLMDDGSYAFRKNASYSYKTAVDDLVRYRRQHANEKLYVAECDIQSFFDVIHHQVVLEAYDGFVQQLEENERPDPQVRKIVEGYLDCFTSRGNLSVSDDPKVVPFRHLVKPLDATGVQRFYPRQCLSEIPLGIPQGGALSPLMANIVLHSADRAVRSLEDPDLLYIRFCDDIIIVHTDRQKCNDALIRYMKALEMLRLPVHPLRKRFSPVEYFKLKSKGPFVWANPTVRLKTAIPVVSFLGVHVRHDGAVCVRPSSVEKHEETLKRELRRFKDAVGPSGRNLKDSSEGSRMSVLKAFEARIVAMGTGYSTMKRPDVGRRCWAAAFPAVTADDPAAQQLRRLDSTRGHIVAAMKKALGFKPGPLPSEQRAFYGRPYSYYGILSNVERHHSYPEGISHYGEW